MSERYTQIGIKGAMCVVVLLITVWEMAAPTEATTGESLTAEQALWLEHHISSSGLPARWDQAISRSKTTTIGKVGNLVVR